jgi:DNA transposition AAA+ family ATPase
MRSKIVPVKNVARLASAARALTTRAPGAPGMGLVEGETGYGKSTAVAWLSNQVPSIYVRALACWSPNVMLTTLCDELRIANRGSNGALVTRIVESLSRSGQAVFVDEADYITRSERMTETLRDLHDLATVPVILIGMAGIAQKLSHRKQLTGRIAQHVTFEALDLDDAALIARELCDVTIKPDLLERVHADTRGSVRLMVVSLARIEQHAKAKAMSSIGAADWGAKRQLFTGEAPSGNVTSLAAVR